MSVKPFSSKTFLFYYSSSPLPYSIFASHFSSYSATPLSRPHSSRRLPEDPRNVKVSVWWDFENCQLPKGVNVFKVAQTITAAIRENGIKGPVQITAFGDVLLLPKAKQEALSLTGISLTHVPNGGKNSADRFLLVDLMHWVSQNPPPAHLFLISSDNDFAGVLHRLRMNNYNILLASRDATPILCSAASIMWCWNALVRGESLTGKVFNQPPDGPYGSWYGRYNVPLEDPFLVAQPTYSEDELTEASTEGKVRPIPKLVVKQIHDMLMLYPKGIPISIFRTELARRKVDIDKDFYGFKRFMPFLMSMPDILTLKDKQYVVPVMHDISVKPEPFKLNSCVAAGPVMGDANLHSNSMNPNGKDTPMNESVDEEPLMSSSLDTGADVSAGKVQECPPFIDKAAKSDNEKPQEEIGAVQSIDEKFVEVGNALIAEDDPKTEEGFLKKIWRRWFSSSDDVSGNDNYDIPSKSYSFGDNYEKKCENILYKCGPSVDSFKKKTIEKEIVEPPNQGSVPVSPALSNSQSNPVKESSMSSELHSEKRGKIINRIKQWCNFWGNSPSASLPADQHSVKQMNNYSGRHEILCDDSFWREMDSFFDSHPGSLVVSQSKTREEMARNLQKDGPSVLRSINECDALQLVDMLISEKKWVEEYPAEASPFKLTRSVEENTSLGDSTSNSLRSIFLAPSVQSNLKRQPECDGDGKTGRVQNISHAGVSKPVRRKKLSERSRSETLMDCQKLVDEILKEFPEGYDIGSFRKLFFERCGYMLDIEKLGYRRLTSLIEVMPRVKIESRYIVPASKMPEESVVHNIQKSDIIHSSEALGGELSDTSKSDESDFTWEELGPINKTSTSRKAPEEKCSYPQYEPTHADDKFSDSEGEPSPATQLEGPAKSEMNIEDSSLIQILDSWYSSENGANRKGKAMISSENGLQPSDQSGLGTKTGTSIENYYQKRRPQKNYSFVADFDVDDSDGNNSGANSPDKLIKGVLGNLKKSSGSGMKSC